MEGGHMSGQNCHQDYTYNFKFVQFKCILIMMLIEQFLLNIGLSPTQNILYIEII